MAISGEVELNPGPVPSGLADSDPGPRRASADGVRGQLSCLQQNVRSLKNKLETLRACAPVLQQHDVLAFTETWLKPFVEDSELSHGLSGWQHVVPS